MRSDWPTKPRLGADPGQFTRRALLMGLGHTAVFGALATRLYQLQVLEGAETALLADDNRMRQLPTVPLRGRIIDASGQVLASNRQAFRIMYKAERGIDIWELRPLLRRLAPMLDLSQDQQERLTQKARQQSPNQPLLIAEGVTFEQVAALEVRRPELTGITTETMWARTFSAPTQRDGLAMAHVVGYVGAVERRALDDEPLLRLAETRVGKAGVEAGMELELRGIAGTDQIEVDAKGREVRKLKQSRPRPGQDIRLTVDTIFQAQVCERLARDGRPGAAVILDVETGGVKALASTPSYDPALLAGAGSRAAWRDLNANTDHPLLNRTIAGQYPPGSTFKMVTALAALDAGAITAKEKIECWGDVTVAGHTFHCWNRKGHIASDLHKALRESCDCYFYEAARRVGMEAIAAKARALGLGQTFNAGISGQKAGLIPTPGWKRNRGPTGWLIGETIMAGIGQGYVLATPLQLAVMMARVATGRAVEPTLVQPSAGEAAPQFEALPVSASSLEAVRSGLVAVVNEAGGTGQAADPDDGHTVVAGKTGTSQVSRASAARDPSVILKNEQRDHALFVAYFPAAKPKYAVSVVLEHAGGGGAQAAPLARDLIKLLLEKDRQEPSVAPPAAREPDIARAG